MQARNNTEAPTDVAWSELRSLRLSSKPALSMGIIFLLKTEIVKLQLGDDSQKAFLQPAESFMPIA